MFGKFNNSILLNNSKNLKFKIIKSKNYSQKHPGETSYLNKHIDFVQNARRLDKIDINS